MRTSVCCGLCCSLFLISSGCSRTRPVLSTESPNRLSKVEVANGYGWLRCGGDGCIDVLFNGRSVYSQRGGTVCFADVTWAQDSMSFVVLAHNCLSPSFWLAYDVRRRAFTEPSAAQKSMTQEHLRQLYGIPLSRDALAWSHTDEARGLFLGSHPSSNE
jgi:hypothetical protein